jgi:MoxR-like ATPase
MRDGSLLYVEEINRIPEETVNVLITVMSEQEIHVPRLGRVAAAPGFRLVAAMNPFDAVGTARISSAVYDRTCRLAVGYQDAPDEVAITVRVAGEVAAASVAEVAWVAKVVEVVRRTRAHPDVRIGSSVRGAIDTVLVAHELAGLRGERTTGRNGGDPLGLDAALVALSGRIRVREGVSRSAEDVIREIWDAVFAVPLDGEAGSGDAGKVPAPEGAPTGR